MLAPTLTPEKLLHTLTLNGWEGGGGQFDAPPCPVVFPKMYLRERG